MDDALTTRADEFVELRFRAGTWEKKGIPERGCWIRMTDLEAMIEAGGNYTVPQLAHCLVDWLIVTDDTLSAKRTLLQLLDRHFPNRHPSKPDEIVNGGRISRLSRPPLRQRQ